MLKATTGSLLALSLAVSLAACGKKEPPVETAKAPEAPAPAAQPQVPAEHPAQQPGAAVDLSGIARAEGGKTVAEVYGEKDALAGQNVRVRGKVVKVNSGIMGKNWLHIRDGSGSDGTNDLTVTTTGALPTVGDTVVVNGTVAINRDFGAGYSYDVIVEEAEVTVE